MALYDIQLKFPADVDEAMREGKPYWSFCRHCATVRPVPFLFIRRKFGNQSLAWVRQELKCPVCDVGRGIGEPRRNGDCIMIPPDGEVVRGERPIDEMVFRVEEWTHDGKHIFQVLARTMNLDIGRAAWRTACRVIPNRLVTLRQGWHVLRASDRYDETGKPDNDLSAEARSDL